MLVQSFAGGVLLTLLADTMMPEAFKYGGKQVGFVATLRFALASFNTTIWLRYGPTLACLTVLSVMTRPSLMCQQ